MPILGIAAGLLPFIALFLFIFAFSRKSPENLQAALAKATLLWGILIVAETNALSMSGLLARGPITIFWTITTICSIFTIPKLNKSKGSGKFGIDRFSIAIGSICFLTLVAALAYPPNYPDSLSYHLPRVMHWLQNGSLAPYFTSNERQIGMAPFNAWVILQSVAISGTDYLVNLPQWLAFCGSIATSWHIAGQLGLNQFARKLTAFFFCTTPIAIMQAANSENSLIVTYWLALFFSAFLDWLRKPGWQPALLIGCSLGLALLTKGNAAPIAIPFVLYIAWICLRHLKKLIVMGAVMAILVVIINMPHFYRNYTATGQLFLSAEKNILSRPGPALIAVNATYNFLLQEPWLVAAFTKKGWSNFATSLGVDDSNKTLFPWGGIETARSNLVPSDNDGQSPIHALAILMAITWLIYKRPPNLRSYLALFLASLFCFIALLCWQPWGARLQLPFFVLAAPLVGYLLASLSSSLIRKTSILILAASAVMPLFFCLEHPLGPPSVLSGFRENIGHFLTSSREENYFNMWRSARNSYLAALDYLVDNKAVSIGLDLGDNGIEHPLWAILAKKMNPPPRISHIGSPYPQNGERPDYIFRQPLKVFGQLPEAVILKKDLNGYKQVFPDPLPPGESHKRNSAE